ARAGGLEARSVHDFTIFDPALATSITSLDVGVTISKRSSHRDLYLNGMRVVDDLQPGGRVVFEHVLDVTRGFVQIVNGDDPDNSNPLDTVFVDFLKRDTFELSDTYDLTIASDPQDSLVAVVVPDVRLTAMDPGKSDIAFVHTGGRLSPVSVNEFESPDPPLVSALAFAEWTDYSSHDPGLTFLEISADDQTAYDVFAVSLEAGKSYIAHVSATRDDPPQLLLSVADADGMTVDTQVVTGTEDGVGPLDEAFSLSPNYPDPFRDRTTIEFTSTGTSQVSLVVFDLLGREVRRLVDGASATTGRRVEFDATGLPAGVYFYVLEADGRRIVRSMTLAR
ncbi:MAG: T9SS type A sorting domain-containing protein, partial [Rhodothermales bacterium]|nr:T9SS type A sorting domain-containing protein [Rhodothermales bacterium]